MRETNRVSGVHSKQGSVALRSSRVFGIGSPAWNVSGW